MIKIKKKIFIKLIQLLLFIVCTLVYFGNYSKKHKITKTIAKIKNINLEEKKILKPSKLINKIINYENKSLFRLKINYLYKKSKIFNGYFYNDCKKSNFIEYDEIKKIWKKYKYNENQYIKIYYLDSDPFISGISKKHVIIKYDKIYVNSCNYIAMIFIFIIIVFVICYFIC